MKYLVSILFFVSVSLFGQTVYKTPSGTKYHTANCSIVKNASSKLNMNAALQSGLMPCKRCNPPYSSTYGIISAKTKKVGGTNKGNRCFGTTKSGTRCKHFTKIGNDYCFQHTPK